MSTPTNLEQILDALLRSIEQGPDASSLPALQAFRDVAEAWRIRSALRECGGNRSVAARALGISRRGLYFKMRSLESRLMCELEGRIADGAPRRLRVSVPVDPRDAIPN